MILKKLNTLHNYKYLVALISVFNFLLTPIHVALTGIHPAHVVVINYTLVILSSSLIATSKISQITTYILGFLTLICIWLEYTFNSQLLEWGRLTISFLLFISFCILLIQQLIKIKKVNLHFILGPLLGFLYFGILGGILFEIVHLLDAHSFQFSRTDTSNYIFYYFSFISITTVGYGDITPLTPSAQSLTIVLNIIGQFYLAIVIAVFVGKYINTKS